MFAVPNRKGRIEEEIERELLRRPLYFCRSGRIGEGASEAPSLFLPFKNDLCRLRRFAHSRAALWYALVGVKINFNNVGGT